MPRATANSSSTIRIVAAMPAMLQRAAPSATRAPAEPVLPFSPAFDRGRPPRFRDFAPVARHSPTGPDDATPCEVRPVNAAARPKLAAESRTVTGKRVAHLRREGRLPAVVFGHGVESSN